MGTIRKLFTNILLISFSWLLYIFPLKNLPGKENYSEIYAHYLYFFLIKIRYSWIFWKLFMKRNILLQITILVNRTNIHEMKFWWIGIGIYLWPKYQRIDLWRIYSRTICKLFANRELFAEHCFRLKRLPQVHFIGCQGVKFLANPGKARGCSINSLVIINWLINLVSQ